MWNAARAWVTVPSATLRRVLLAQGVEGRELTKSSGTGWNWQAVVIHTTSIAFTMALEKILDTSPICQAYMPWGRSSMISNTVEVRTIIKQKAEDIRINRLRLRTTSRSTSSSRQVAIGGNSREGEDRFNRSTSRGKNRQCRDSRWKEKQQMKTPSKAAKKRNHPKKKKHTHTPNQNQSRYNPKQERNNGDNAAFFKQSLKRISTLRMLPFN